VKFNDELTPGRKRVLIGRINLRRAQLNPKIAELGARIDVLLAEKKEFGFIKRDFATFSSSSHLTAKPVSLNNVTCISSHQEIHFLFLSLFPTGKYRNGESRNASISRMGEKYRETTAYCP